MALPIEKTLGFLADLIAQHVYLDGTPKTMRRRWNLSGFTVTDDPNNERLDISVGVSTLTSDGDAALLVEYDASAVVGDAIGVDINETAPPTGKSIGLRFRRNAVTALELLADGSGYGVINAPTQLQIGIADLPNVTHIASATRWDVDSLYFDKDLTGVSISYETRSSGAASPMGIIGQSTSGAAGGRVYAQAGNGSSWGTVDLVDGGGTTRVQVTSAGVVYIGAGGLLQVAGSTVTVNAVNLSFAAAIAAPKINQTTKTGSGAIGETMLVHAQDTNLAGGGDTGGNIDVRPGNGTTKGVLALQDGGGTDRVTIDATGKVEIDSLGTVNIKVSGSNAFYADSSIVQSYKPTFRFASTAVNPSIFQADGGDEVCDTFTLHAQDSNLGGSDAGGWMYIRPGHGTTEGQLFIQDGGSVTRFHISGTGDVTIDSNSTLHLQAGATDRLNIDGSTIYAKVATIEFDSTLSTPTIQQGSRSSGTGQSLTLKGQANTGGAGGSAWLQGGSGSTNDGQAGLRDGGGSARVYVDSNGDYYVSAAGIIQHGLSASGVEQWYTEESFAPEVKRWRDGVQTTNATITNIKTYTSATGETFGFEVKVNMRSQTDGDSGYFHIVGSAENTGGTLTIMAQNTLTSAAQDGTWGTVMGAAVVVDATGAILRIKVEGGAGDTVDWGSELTINKLGVEI